MISRHSFYNFCKALSLLALSCLLLPSCGQETTKAPDEEQEYRLVSLSGYLTELLVTLGHGEQLVGVDVTSTFPKEVTDSLPNLGHVTQLNAEAILALRPTHLFVEKKQLGQSPVFEQLKAAGLQIIAVPTTFQLSNPIQGASVIRRHLNTTANKVEVLEQRIQADSIKLAQVLREQSHQPSVLFIYARGANRLLVAGKQTAAASMIQIAGGANAIQDFEGFKTLSAESLLDASPDIILMFDKGLESLDGREGIAQIVGIAQTPAFRKNRIITMDGHYLTAFGPRVGQAACELAQKMQERQ